MPPQFQNQPSPIVSTQPLLPSKRSHAFLLILTALLLATGAFGIWYFSNPLPEEETETVSLANKFAGWKTYKNEKYGFGFKHPADHTVYSTIDAQKESLVPANSQSDKIAITEKESMLFCCESTTLDISVVASNASSREWIDKNYMKYTSQEEIKSIKEVKLNGVNATELVAGGNLGSTYKLIVVPINNNLLIINQNSESKFLDEVLSSFKFTKNEKLSIATESDLQAVVGQPFSAIFKPVGGARPYNWDGESTSFLYRDDSWNLKSFMNFRKIDCDDMPAQNMQCYQIYGTPLQIQSFPFEIILTDSTGAKVTKHFNLVVSAKQ